LGPDGPWSIFEIHYFVFFDVEGTDFNLNFLGNILEFLEIDKALDKPWMSAESFAEKIEIRRAQGCSEKKQPIRPKLLAICHVKLARRPAYGLQAKPVLIECIG